MEQRRRRFDDYHDHREPLQLSDGENLNDKLIRRLVRLEVSLEKLRSRDLGTITDYRLWKTWVFRVMGIPRAIRYLPP